MQTLLQQNAAAIKLFFFRNCLRKDKGIFFFKNEEAEIYSTQGNRA